MTLPGGNPSPIETWPGSGSQCEFQALKTLSMFNEPSKTSGGLMEPKLHQGRREGAWHPRLGREER